MVKGVDMANKSELVQLIANDLGGDLTIAKKSLDAVVKAIVTTVAGGDRATITGFGTFMSVARNERMARNPINGEKIHVPAKNAVIFRAGADLRASVNAGSNE
jgi:DNA-binding protein HU-beta